MEEPARKRVRLDPRAPSSLATRTNDDIATSLEVDHMILDYLIYQAINICFDNRNTSARDHEDDISPVDRALSQVDEFLALFNTRYPRYRLDAEIQFRELLLQVVTLFTQRLTLNNTTPPLKSLSALRNQNRARAHDWIKSAKYRPTADHSTDHLSETLSIPTEHIVRQRARVLHQNSVIAGTKPSTTPSHYGQPSSISLLDLLPLFMRLSASFQNLLNISVSKTWCDLAVGWMLQACLEQYLIYRANGKEILDEAFAWGFNPGAEGGIDGDEGDKVNDMFKDDESEQEIPGWKEMRQRALEKLCPKVGWNGKNSELVGCLLDAAEENPMRRTEERILEYFKGLSRSIPEPVLVQLEKGQLQGMTEMQTREFMRNCGLSEEEFGREASCVR
ncbi:unnamed protein product [Zymoseptoria tritici ST99CH_1A5]|uniref:Uncharacterized protein n=1 Tax=Zymoseptoria tritici ST99CH_1A5 TaxID=1276529 RepID=A0A1Y6LWX2_ZYMTR|nr:unnamed protein product [Zymoseptoria tritici ST99CH_1A5]